MVSPSIKTKNPIVKIELTLGFPTISKSLSYFPSLFKRMLRKVKVKFILYPRGELSSLRLIVCIGKLEEFSLFVRGNGGT